jgi:hypothetical protein
MTEAKTKEGAPAAAPAPGKPRPPDSFSFFTGIFLDGHKRLNIKLFNVLLFLCVAALAVRFSMIVDGSLKKMRSMDFRITSNSSGEYRDKTVLKKIEYYLDQVKKRDIFKMGMAAKQENTIDAGPSSKAVEATQNLKLVGISWSDDPDAMVEDIKAMKTFFVKKGQLIGEVKVENVTKDKIVLRFGQELIELR